MSRVETIIAIALAVSLAALVLNPIQKTPRGKFIHAAVATTGGAALVAVAWAICFIRRLEANRVSLFSLFALLTAEAVFFWAIQFFKRAPSLH
jgi:hypothetical protein